MSKVQSAAAWNRQFEGERMKYVSSQPPCAKINKELWRRCGEGLQVSSDGNMRRIDERELLSKEVKTSTCINNEYTFEERSALMKEYFPLQSETR